MLLSALPRPQLFAEGTCAQRAVEQPQLRGADGDWKDPATGFLPLSSFCLSKPDRSDVGTMAMGSKDP